MKYPDFISGVFWLCLGLLISLWSTTYRIGNIGNPGPGFLPLLLGLLLIVLSLVLLGQAKQRTPQSLTPYLLRGGWKKVVYTVSITVLAAFLFEPLGYLLTFFFLLILLIRGAGPQSFRTTLLIAFFSALIIYLIFVLLLKQQLPKGLLGI
jgi:putative tricarboxylic transport membrane protein